MNDTVWFYSSELNWNDQMIPHRNRSQSISLIVSRWIQLVCVDIGEFLSQRLRFSEAADNLVKAAELEPNSIAAIVAAAHALHDARRNLEAEQYFRKAVQLNPNVFEHLPRKSRPD